jgi:hypothetical protein
MVKRAVFDAFLIFGIGLWTVWEITLKVYEYYEYRIFSVFFKLILHVIVSIMHDA